jgi:hypothetical protein
MKAISAERKNCPGDDVTALQVSFYLVGKKSLDNDMITGFARAMTSARTDLLGELPILAQLKAPDTDPGVTVLCERASWLAQDIRAPQGSRLAASKLF